MQHSRIVLAALAAATFAAADAHAQCAFDGAPAKGIKGTYVRNMAPCPGTEHPTPNTETEGGTDACTPVTPAEVEGQGTLYSYGPKGKCSVSTQAKLVKDCSKVKGSDGEPLGLQAVPCHITYVKSKCSGILGTDGQTPIGPTDDGWKLATLSRASLADNSNGDMTVIDFPVTFDYSVPSNGKIEVNSNSAEALIPLVGINNADLPTCTTIEVVDTTIKAPGGLPFAKLGQATRE